MVVGRGLMVLWLWVMVRWALVGLMVVVLVLVGRGFAGPMVMGLGHGAVFLMDCGSDDPMVVDLVGGEDGGGFFFFFPAMVCCSGWLRGGFGCGCGFFFWLVVAWVVGLWWLWYGWWFLVGG